MRPGAATWTSVLLRGASGAASPFITRSKVPSELLHRRESVKLVVGITQQRVDHRQALEVVAHRQLVGPSRNRQSSSLAVRKRRELAMTLTEDSAIAAAATTGESRMPKTG